MYADRVNIYTFEIPVLFISYYYALYNTWTFAVKLDEANIERPRILSLPRTYNGVKNYTLNALFFLLGDIQENV